MESTTLKRFGTILIALFLMLLLSSCGNDSRDSKTAQPLPNAPNAAEEEDIAEPDEEGEAPRQQVTVTNVVDGDTIDVSTGSGDTIRVRLIGLDAPESVHPDDSQNTELGRIASEYTDTRLFGKRVELEFDVQELDEYGRTLAYVWLDDELFNAQIIRDGYAQVSTFPPNVKHTDILVASQEQAHETGAGMWAAASGSSDSIPWSEAIDHIGETATFSGKVVGTRYATSSNGKPTFLNIGADYPDSGRLTVLIWGSDRGNFSAAPESMYAGKTISVTGTVESYGGAAQIQVSSPSQITILH